jgi:hypothetical protein
MSPIRLLKKRLVLGLINKAEALGKSGKKEEALAAFDDLAKRFESTRNPGVRIVLVEALFSKAVTLRWLDRTDEAVQLRKELIVAESDSTSEAVPHFVGKAREYVSTPDATWGNVAILHRSNSQGLCRAMEHGGGGLPYQGGCPSK